MSHPNFDPAKDIASLEGRVIFITGGTAGLGSSSISILAKHNPAHIYFSGRNSKSANSLIEKVQAENPEARLTFVECDLASMESVKGAAAKFTSASERLDVLMCNAGVMALDPGVTKDGYEIQFGTNHMGHALLIKELLPTMLRTAEQPGGDVRIVSMASIAYKQAPSSGIEFDTLKSTQAKLGNAIVPGHKWSRYGQSKLANLLYPRELAKVYPSITSVAIHPGVIMTGLFENVSFATKLPVLLGLSGEQIPVEQGCLNQVWAATCDKSKLENGQYYVPVAVKGQLVTKPSKDEELSKRLWEWTQKELESFA